MPANYVLLEKIVVGAAGATSVTFANIPQTGYTDLVVKSSLRSSYAAFDRDDTKLTFNSSTTGYSDTYLVGTGSAALAGYNGWTGVAIYPGQINTAITTSNTFTNLEFYIPNYAGSNYKSVSVDSTEETNATAARAFLVGGLWSNTAAITSITLTSNGGSLVQGSTLYLYGVAKLGTTPAIAPKATGGDIIDTDGTYWYHTFLSSGTFTPALNLTTDYLVIAGGGSGGLYTGGDALAGGGGAGGYRTSVGTSGGGGSAESPLSLSTNTAYTVTIGAGGAGVTNTSGNSGSNTTFSTITSVGGGGGGFYSANGKTGGSGGGAGTYNTNLTGGTATANQGYAGSSSVSATASGGGGGAGSVGSGYTGGNAITSTISGASVARAGGGGGVRFADPKGGSGGGGGATAGAGDGVTSTSATPNTGSGSGGVFNASGPSGNGASGVVIIRYTVA